MSRRTEREVSRSGKQKCAVCLEYYPLVEHHLCGRGVKDWDKPWNRCRICANCHDKVHLQEGNSERVILEGWYGTTGGRRLVWHKEGEESITGYDCVCPTYAQERREETGVKFSEQLQLPIKHDVVSGKSCPGKKSLLEKFRDYSHE